MDWQTIINGVNELALLCREMNYQLATAESCSGGLISAALTEISGSSHWFDRGFVTYSNQAKQELLSVPEQLLLTDGAVSESVARAMAEGALKFSKADCSLAVTGIAGPHSDSTAKPVGMVHFAWAKQGGVCHHDMQIFSGDRQEIRLKTVNHSILGAIKFIRQEP